MPFNHEAVAALPVLTAADKALIRAMSTRRFAYALTAAESATNFVAVDPDTGVIPLYLIQGGSLFAYDSADSTTTHDGITCLVSSDGKRFKTTDFAAFLALITKASVGLGNVDNTSDATKNAAVAILTNKALVAPVGGTAVGSTLTLNGTSNGSPVNAYLILQSNGQFVGVNNVAPQYILHVGAGTDASSLSPQLYVSAAGTTAFAVRDSTNHIEFGAFTNAAPAVVVMGARTNHPLWIQTNSVNNFAFHVSAGFSVGDTVDPGTGSISATGSVKSKSATAGVGYAAGAGGTITQVTSKATGVTLNASSGAITMNAAALAAGTIVSFVLTDSAIAATDVLILNHISGGTPGSYSLNARCAAGSATIDVRNNTAGSLSEAIVIQFALIKAVNA